MSSSPVDVGGGGYDGLRRAAEVIRRGERVDFLEPGLRAGGRYVTESFLTPFRFNLGPALVPRREVAWLRLLEPDPLVAVGEARLSRAPVELVGTGTVRETLDASGVSDRGQRALLLALALLLGIDPEAADSGVSLARTAVELDDLVAVEGGNGLAAASLVDEIVAGGGHVVEGAGGSAPEQPQREGLGICRLFVGLRRSPPAQAAFAEARGFDDEQSLERRLAELRNGTASVPVGLLLSNGHLDPNRSGDPLGSFVWQGILPMTDGGVSRRDYTRAVLDALGIAERDVVFKLLWLPAETREALS